MKSLTTKQLEQDQQKFEAMLTEQRQFLNDAQINCVKLEGVLEYIYGCQDKIGAEKPKEKKDGRIKNNI